MKWGRQWTVRNVRGKNWKYLKTDLYAQNTRFSRLSQVASKSPGPVARTLKTKILKNLSKCFLRLEVLLARESRGKSWKSLCTPYDWNIHPWTSRQIESREILKTQILKNILRIFHDWTNPRLSRQYKATLFFEILTFFFLQKQKTFQKQLKHLKIFLCLINKDWAYENTFNQVQSHKWIWHSLNIDMCVVCKY